MAPQQHEGADPEGFGGDKQQQVGGGSDEHRRDVVAVDPWASGSVRGGPIVQATVVTESAARAGYGGDVPVAASAVFGQVNALYVDDLTTWEPERFPSKRRRHLTCLLCMALATTMVLVAALSKPQGTAEEEPRGTLESASPPDLSAGAPPLQRCDERRWRGVGSVCADCTVVVVDFADRWDGQCFNYCSSLEMACTGAWSPGAERTCDGVHGPTEHCDLQFQSSSMSHDTHGVCRCEPASADTAVATVALSIPIEDYNANPQEFKQQFAEGMGDVLGVGTDRIVVVAVMGGSVEVQFFILPPDADELVMGNVDEAVVSAATAAAVLADPTFLQESGDRLADRGLGSVTVISVTRPTGAPSCDHPDDEDCAGNPLQLIDGATYFINNPSGPQPLRQAGEHAVVSVPADYTIGFEIVPEVEAVASWGSILHLTATGNNCCNYGDRIPAVWFHPGSHRLHVRDGHGSDGNAGCDPPDELPARQATVVRIEMRPLSVVVYYNDELKCTQTRGDRRVFDDVVVYASDPWHVPARASINRFYMHTVRDMEECVFSPGDGVGGTEVLVGVAPSEQACAVLVHQQEPTANGATYSTAAAPFEADSSVLLEVGMVSAGLHAVTVPFQGIYSNPVVIAGTPTHNGDEEIALRVRDIGEFSFDIYADTPNRRGCGATTHASEDFGFLIIDAGMTEGTYEAGSGSYGQCSGGVLCTVDLGCPTCDHSTGFDWLDVEFSAPIENAVVVSQIQSHTGGDWVKTRQRSVSRTGFQVKLEEDGGDNGHNTELYGWVAVHAGAASIGGVAFEAIRTPNAVTHEPYEIIFASTFEERPAVFSSMQTFNGRDPAHLRLTSAATASGCSIFIEEETCSDDELAHVAESLGIFAVAANWGRSECFAEFGMTGRNDSPSWQSCLFE